MNDNDEKTLLDEQARQALNAGNAPAYHSAVRQGANPNPGSSNSIEDLDTTLGSEYSQAKAEGDVVKMILIANEKLGVGDSNLSFDELKLLRTAAGGDVTEIASAIKGIYNAQLFDVARDIAQVSGKMAQFRLAQNGQPDIILLAGYACFANAMTAAGNIARGPDPKSLDKKRDLIQHNAVRGGVTMAESIRNQLQDREQENQRRRNPRVRNRNSDAA